MNEARFSANFRLPNPAGVETQFTVRSDVSIPDLISQVSELNDRLLSAGYGAPAGSGTERTFECTGVVVGQYKDNKENKYRRNLHLYAANGKWKQATVYPEKIQELPRWVLDAVNAANKSPVLQAPDSATAKDTGVLIPLPRTFKVVMALRVDHDNNPILTDDGKKQYKVDRFIELDGSAAPVASTAADHAALVANTDVPF